MSSDEGPGPSAALAQRLAILERVARLAASALEARDLAHGALDALLGAMGAEGGVVYAVAGDQLVELTSIVPPGDPRPPAQMPLTGTYNATLLAAAAPRQWSTDEVPPRVRATIPGPGRLVFATAAIPSGTRQMGLVHIVRRRPDPYGADELALLGTVLAQIGPAMELAVVRGSDGGSAGRELSVLHRITAAAGRTLELQTVVNTCVELTRELTGADVVTLHLLDEFGEQLALAAGDLVEGAEPFSALPAELLLERVHDPRPRLESLEDLPEPYRHVCEGAGLRRFVTLPLLAGDAPVGLLSLAFRSAPRFSPATLATLAAMAEQQALAIDSARSQHLTQIKARLSGLVRQVAERALTVTDEHATYDVLLEGLIGLCESPSARLALLDDAGALRSVAARGVPPELEELAPLGPDDPFVARVHAAAGPLVYTLPDQLTSGPWAAAFRRAGLSSLVVVPLRLRGQLLGLLSSHSPSSRRLHREQQEALALMASVAVAALEALRQRRDAERQRARLGQIVEHLPLPVMVLDEQARFEQINAAYRIVNPRARIGESWFEAAALMELRTDADAKVPLESMAVSRALRGEAGAVSDLRIRLGGAWHNVVTHANALRAPSGEPEGLVAAIQDVTALRELADAKDRFLDVASHELRSPLSALKACTSLLDIDPAAILHEGRRKQLTGRIHQQIDRLVLLVDDLVEMARIRGGTLRLMRGAVDLTEVVRDVVELSRLQSDRHRIQVLAAGPVEGVWDRQRIIQVATNLISNAARYSPDGGEIVVRVADHGATALLSVEDQGIGIGAEEQARLFEPYFRGASAGQVARGGLGLGLYITAEIVRHHQGHIEVESQPGKGSRFTVRLPREPPSP